MFSSLNKHTIRNNIPITQGHAHMN